MSWPDREALYHYYFILKQAKTKKRKLNEKEKKRRQNAITKGGDSSKIQEMKTETLIKTERNSKENKQGAWHIKEMTPTRLPNWSTYPLPSDRPVWSAQIQKHAKPHKHHGQLLHMYRPITKTHHTHHNASVKLEAVHNIYPVIHKVYPHYIYGVDNTSIGCGCTLSTGYRHPQDTGMHEHASSTLYIHNICNLPTIYMRYPQYIWHPQYTFRNIHPQDKSRHPQDKTCHPHELHPQDTRTGYQYAPTTYVVCHPQLSWRACGWQIIACGWQDLYSVGNFQRYPVDRIMWITYVGYVVGNPQHIHHVIHII